MTITPAVSPSAAALTLQTQATQNQQAIQNQQKTQNSQSTEKTKHHHHHGGSSQQASSSSANVGPAAILELGSQSNTTSATYQNPQNATSK